MINSLTISSSIPSSYFKLVNFIIFQSVWCLGVFTGNTYVLVSAALIAAHFFLSQERRTDLQALLIIAPIGITVDLFLSISQVFVFDISIIPVWLLLLWFAFSLTIVHSLAWIRNLPMVAQVFLGAFGGTSSYYAGYRFGAVDFGHPELHTCIILALVWGCKIPLFYFLVDRYVKK
ncbi:MAG: DUF2878 domain-containing protein [Agarilytica sp.]